MAEQSFDATVESGDRGRVFISVPFDPAETWGRKPRHHVAGTIGGMAFTGSLGTRGGGAYFFPLNKELQQKAGVSPGDTVRVTMAPAAPAEAGLPEELAAALEGEPEAAEFFGGLSAFYRNQYVGWITGAKRAETREGRVRETVELLKAGKKQR